MRTSLSAAAGEAAAGAAGAAWDSRRSILAWSWETRDLRLASWSEAGAAAILNAGGLGSGE